jgi:hypothetical protein
MKIHVTMMMLCAAALSQGQMLFQENFELEPQGERGILGRQNDWKEAWNKEGDSLAKLVDMNLNWEAPFAARGLAIQIDNSRQTAFYELPEALNGRTFYFSFLMRYFQEEGGTGQFRIRSDAGHVLGVGFSNDQFLARAHNEETSWGVSRHRETYFVAGKVEISADGRSIRLSAKTYTTRASIPLEAPEEWGGTVAHQGPDRRWNGLEFMAASQNVAFDDLRLGLTWRDVAGVRR